MENTICRSALHTHAYPRPQAKQMGFVDNNIFQAFQLIVLARYLLGVSRPLSCEQTDRGGL